MDWLGDIGGLLDALKYIGQIVMFPFFKFMRVDPIVHGLVTSLFKREAKNYDGETDVANAVSLIKKRKQFFTLPFYWCGKRRDKILFARGQ